MHLLMNSVYLNNEKESKSQLNTKEKKEIEWLKYVSNLMIDN